MKKMEKIHKKIFTNACFRNIIMNVKIYGLKTYNK